MQLGDRLVFVRSLDGATLIGKINGSDWQDDPEAGSFVLKWPMQYVEREMEKDGQRGTAFGCLPPSEMFAVPRLEVRHAARCILSDEAVKRIGQCYEQAVKTEQAKDSGIIVPALAMH